MSDITYIYALIDPRDDEVRYVGKADIVPLRFMEHLLEAEDGSSSAKSVWINELSSLGIKPFYEVLEEVPVADWREAEIYWIAFYRDTVFNVHIGGLGGRTWELSEAERQKLRELTVRSNKLMWSDPEMKRKIGDSISKAAPREVLRQLALKRWADPDWAPKVKENIRAANQKPERREKISRAKKAALADPGKLHSLRESMKAAWADPDKKRQRLTKRQTPEYSKKLSDAQKRRFENPEERVSMAEKSRRRWTQTLQDRLACTIREVWNEYKERGAMLDRSEIMREVHRRLKSGV